MATRRVFVSLSTTERIKKATEGMSISHYATGKSQPVSKGRGKEIEKISSKVLSDFDRRQKLQPA